ncbi:MAG: 4Fe-4S dicluster domain-containing protein [Proteobacteria bacterium]|nr:4Fe-4S dicluster domain-containing protein [Pseudomonadota bacterium]
MNKHHDEVTAPRYGMVIDLDKCTGCGACMVACMTENNVPFKENETNKLDSIAWMRIFKISNREPFPKADMVYLPRPCMQCDGKHIGHPPCVSVCPATATDYDQGSGIVSQIYTRCFGCRYCMAACPYLARQFNWWDPHWPADTKKYLSPDVSPRMRGIVEKCSFCYHRLQRAKDRAYYEGRDTVEEDEYQTSCTQACPAGAITFGDLNNADHEVHGLKNDPRAFRLLENLDTNPKVYYMTGKKWVRQACDYHIKDEAAKTKAKPEQHG